MLTTSCATCARRRWDRQEGELSLSLSKRPLVLMAVLVRALPSRPSRLAADAPFSRSQPYVETELGPGTVQLLRDIKRQMDPQNILVRPLPCFSTFSVHVLTPSTARRTRASCTLTRRARRSAWRTEPSEVRLPRRSWCNEYRFERPSSPSREGWTVESESDLDVQVTRASSRPRPSEVEPEGSSREGEGALWKIERARIALHECVLGLSKRTTARSERASERPDVAMRREDERG